MKNVHKKHLALFLAIAMIVTYLPLTSAKAEAASTITWKSAKNTVSIGTRTNYLLKGTKTSHKVSYKVGNKNVGKISKKGSFLAVGKGKRQIAASKSPGKS